MAPPGQPQGTVTYVITPSDGLLTLSSADPLHRFALGAVVGAHAGPGTLALFWCRDDE